MTRAEQHPTGAAAAVQVAAELRKQAVENARVLIVGRATPDDIAFATRLRELLAKPAQADIQVVNGGPVDARRAIEKLSESNRRLDFIACSAGTADWELFRNLRNCRRPPGPRSSDHKAIGGRIF